MRFLMTFFAAGVLFMALADPVEARRGGGSKSQTMHFVADTKIQDEGTTYSLCHLTNTNSVMFVNLFRSLEGYVLAANKCDSEQYYALSAEQLAEAKAEGLIDASVPDAPKLSMGTLVAGHWGLGLVAGVVGFFGLGAMKSRKRRGERRSMMGEASSAATAILDAMCHAAKADGVIAAEEVMEIAQVAEKMTGESFGAERVAQMAKLAEENPKDGDFKRFVSGRSEDEKKLMMRGVLMVVASDGQLDGKEQQFVGKLAQAMKMSGDKINQLLSEVIASHQGATGS